MITDDYARESVWNGREVCWEKRVEVLIGLPKQSDTKSSHRHAVRLLSEGDFPETSPSNDPDECENEKSTDREQDSGAKHKLKVKAKANESNIEGELSYECRSGNSKTDGHLRVDNKGRWEVEIEREWEF